MDPPDLVFGDFRLEVTNQRLLKRGEATLLSPKAFAVLCRLVQSPEQLVSKDALLDSVWPDTHVSDGVLKVAISELRKALEDDSKDPRYIVTVHRRGYRFVATVSAVSEPTLRSGPPPPTLHGNAPSPLVGRDEELARLTQSLSVAATGKRQVVFVSGEAGIGKTALVDAFVATLDPSGAQSARGQCLEHHGSGEAYLPVFDALGQLCRGQQREAFKLTLRRYAPSWLPHMPWLLDAEDAPSPTRGASGVGMQREITDALEAYTETDVLVLVLEDLHWSDASSVDLLARLAHGRAPARLLVIATYRPVDVIVREHPLRSVQQRLAQQRLCEEIRLPPLSDAEIASYTERRLGVSSLPAEFVDTLFERTGGNTLFLVNVIDELIGRGWVTVDSEAVRVDVPLEQIRREVPEGLRQMVEAQARDLEPGLVEILEAASVAGEEFAAAGVAAALDQPVATVEQLCEAEHQRSRFLAALGVRGLPSGDVSGHFRFVHGLFRDVFYERIGGSRRITLHARFGEWLEGAGAGPAELARHFGAAGPAFVDKAVTYWQRAAERAIELFAFSDATVHLRAALDAFDSTSGASDRREEECRLLIVLGECLERSGKVAQAGETFLEAANLARQLDSSDLFAQAVLGLGRGHHPVRAANPLLVDLLEEAVTKIGPAPSAMRARLLARLDTALSPIVGLHERREQLAREALEYVRGDVDPETVLLVTQYTRWAFNGRESPDDLDRSAATMARLAAAAPSREMALNLQLIRLTLLHEIGDTATAVVELDQFHSEADTAGILWFQWFAQRLLAYRAAEAGRFDVAERAMNDALEIGRRTDHPNVIPCYAAQRICLHLQRGLFAEIEPELAGLAQRYPTQFTTRAALAYVRAESGDLDGARAELDVMAADDFAHIPRDSLWLMVLARLSEVCAALRDRVRAAQLRRLFAPHAERIIGAGAAFASAGHGCRYLGLLAQTCGEWDAAAAHLERAAAIHERMGALPWLTQTLYEQGRLLQTRPAKGPARTAARRRGTEHFDRARRLAGELGMRGILAALDKVDA